MDSESLSNVSSHTEQSSESVTKKTVTKGNPLAYKRQQVKKMMSVPMDI